MEELKLKPVTDWRAKVESIDNRRVKFKHLIFEELKLNTIGELKLKHFLIEELKLKHW